MVGFVGRPRSTARPAVQTVARSFALHWARDGLASDKPGPRDTVGRLVEEIVRRSGLAEQTFKRRVAEAAGSLRRSNAYSASRVEGVKRRLKRTDASPDEVSWQVGYEDEAFFPRLFKRFTEMTPEAHRKRFRCPPSLHWAQSQHSIDLDQKSRTRMVYTGLHRVPDFEVASATRAEAASKFL